MSNFADNLTYIEETFLERYIVQLKSKSTNI